MLQRRIGVIFPAFIYLFLIFLLVLLCQPLIRVFALAYARYKGKGDVITVNSSKAKHLPFSANGPHLLTAIDLPLPALVVLIACPSISGPHVPVHLAVVCLQCLHVLLVDLICHLGHARHHRAPCCHLNPVRLSRCIIHRPDAAGRHLVNHLTDSLAVCPGAGGDSQHGLVQAALQVF